MPRATGAPTRDWIARGFTHVEDVLYVALGVLLAAGALVLHQRVAVRAHPVVHLEGGHAVAVALDGVAGAQLVH